MAGAQQYILRVLEASTRVLGPEHPETLNAMLRVAANLWMQNDLEGALKYEQQVLEALTRQGCSVL